MDKPDNEKLEAGPIDRSRRKLFPAAAAAGALAAFGAAAFRVRPEPKASPRPPQPPGPQPAPGLVQLSPQPVRNYGLLYTRSGLIPESASAHPFQHSLDDIAAGPGDRVYALGDGEVRIFEPRGSHVRSWKAPENALCLGVAADGRVFIGAPGRVEIYDPSGNRSGGFEAGAPGKPAHVTAVRAHRQEILVADSAARFIRRYDGSGRQLSEIGNKNKTKGFMLPNRWIDFDVDAKGVVWATDTGRHQVTSWTLDGAPVGAFGKFGMADPVDFVGCCNPVNLALTPDGKIVTAEKMVARVKVYEPGGKLVAVMGPEHFDPMCVHIPLAVDSKGRILAADPVRRAALVFAPAARTGDLIPGGASGKAGIK